MASKRLLVIDDEQEICDLIRDVAEGEGFEVYSTVSPVEFKTAYKSFKPTLVILDLVMPETDGIECLRYLAGLECTAPILVMSGYSGKLLESARSLGDAFGLPSVQSLEKPLRVKLLRAALAASQGEAS
ncbi:MAG: response regulator [Alphaproteobacteria bacterium]